MDVIQSLKSVFDGKRRRKSGDSAYNSENETEGPSSDENSMGRLTQEQRKKLTKKARSQPPLKTRDASQMAHAASGSASPIPKSPCNIYELPIKISAQGLNGPKAMRIDASTEDENSFTITFDGRSRQADETTHLWHTPSFDKTKIRIPEGGWIIEVWLKDPSEIDDSDGPPAGESPEETPTEESPQPPLKESPQTPVEVLQNYFEDSGSSEDEIDGAGIDRTQYPLRLVRMNSRVSVVHMDDQLLKKDPSSSMWALEKHDSYQTMREPSRFEETQDLTNKFLTLDITHKVVFEMKATEDQPPQVTDTTRYLAVDEDTKGPFLVRAGEYFKCLITPQTKLSLANADVYKT